MWSCPKCAESVDGDFECCWNCGTSRDGQPDTTFKHADFIETKATETDQGSLPQFRLRSLLISIACLSVIFAVLQTAVAEILAVAICLILGSFAILHLYGVIYGLLLDGPKEIR